MEGTINNYDSKYEPVFVGVSAVSGLVQWRPQSIITEARVGPLAMCGNGSRDQRPGHLVLPQSWVGGTVYTGITGYQDVNNYPVLTVSDKVMSPVLSSVFRLSKEYWRLWECCFSVRNGLANHELWNILCKVEFNWSWTSFSIFSMLVFNHF